MPVYEFEEYAGKRTNYWGYGRGCYFAPKAAYSAAGDAVAELKEMVKAFHKAGIEVILEMPFEEGILYQTALECLHYYMPVSYTHLDVYKRQGKKFSLSFTEPRCLQLQRLRLERAF